ncbi:unnamed protein product [Spirodela intermedia]|uniref:Uncharacterized protein n=1 Tax=Spirodela intermedia TaxID=51605 RepID=A0A7I8L462_SPIIN|nr:unnamed protein product [Spirodela intermedia]
MESEGGEANWSEAVEDLAEGGDIDGAIAVLESIVARLGGTDASSLAPGDRDGDSLGVAVAAISDLASLHDSRGSPERADDLRKQALILREKLDGARSVPSSLAPPSPAHAFRDSEQQLKGTIPERKDSRVSGGVCDDDDDDVDDWEAVADRPLPDIVGVSSSQETENVRSESTTKRRGRGHFLYKKDGLYSDQLNESGSADRSDSDEELDRYGRGEITELSNSRYATGHVLVLYDFPQSTRTTDLEKIFEAFREDGFAIRWVNDTCALAVFRTPSFASRALSTSPCPFKVRMIEDNSDKILTQISAKAKITISSAVWVDDEEVVQLLQRGGEDPYEIRCRGQEGRLQTSRKITSLDIGIPTAESSRRQISGKLQTAQMSNLTRRLDHFYITPCLYARTMVSMCLCLEILFDLVFDNCG